MKMLHTRLTVTLQSFIWAGRGKERKEDVMKLSNEILAKFRTKSNISIGQALAAREDLLVLSKTASGATRIEADINKHTMQGSVADS